MGEGGGRERRRREGGRERGREGFLKHIFLKLNHVDDIGKAARYWPGSTIEARKHDTGQAA